jgi:L-asparaginase/Glu-tRNA(Gln) amidotransferase subunit D
LNQNLTDSGIPSDSMRQEAALVLLIWALAAEKRAALMSFIKE